MSENKAKVLPVYFVADESGSMSPYISRVNKGLRSLYDAMQGETLAAAKVRFSVYGFSDDSIAHLSLAQLAELEPGQMPALQAKRSTSYKAAFDHLTRQIPLDVASLKSQHFLVHRPAVFFLSDGRPNPNEQWQTAHQALTSETFREAPNILAFGVEDADDATIAQVATQREWAFVAVAGADTGEALTKFMEQLTRSVVNSAVNIANGGADLEMERPAGFKVATPLI